MKMDKVGQESLKICKEACDEKNKTVDGKVVPHLKRGISQKNSSELMNVQTR